MKTSLLKRHPSLQPLSRDHGIGLVCAQRLHKALHASIALNKHSGLAETCSCSTAANG